MEGGEDWVSLGLYVNHPAFKDLAAKLDFAKEAAACGSSKEDEVVFGDTRFIVSASGAREGASGKGSWMRWKLKSENGVTVLIMNRDEAHKTQPNMTIRAPSLVLMQFGIEQLWGMVRYWVDSMGAELVANKVSRVDPCVDLVDVPMCEFMDPYRAGWIVTRAHRRSEHDLGLRMGSHYIGSRPSGFSVGKYPTMLRVYDKITECSRDPLKLALLMANRWGKVPECATRVELELGRERLKRLGVDSIDDWLEKRAAICEKMTREWCRLTAGPVDRNHADRSEMHSIWERTREAFARWCGESGEVDLTPLLKALPDSSRQVSQAVGILKGVFARAGTEVTDNEQFVREAIFAIRDIMGDRDMAEEVRRKALELGVS